MPPSYQPQGQYGHQQGPYQPQQGPYTPQQGPYNPQPGPYNPQQGPYNPQQRPYQPGYGPQPQFQPQQSPYQQYPQPYAPQDDQPTSAPAYEMIIGCGGEQPFMIPGTCRTVSHRHTRFWVDDNGNWFIEDLTGPQGNGTYIRDSSGEFRRINRKRIDRDSVIRLGAGGYNAFTFYANRIIAPDDFSFEFTLLQKQLREIQNEQQRLEAENERKAKKIKNVRLVGGCIAGLSAIGALFSMPGFIGVMAISGAIAGLLPAPNPKELKALLERKKSIMVCPKCFQPISETAIMNRLCPQCKAKG